MGTWLRGILRPRTRQLIAIALMIAGARSQAALAQSAASGQRIIHESWTFKQGAPENVRSLAQATDGYLWLGSAFGLVRFDGARFELFRPPAGDRLLSTSVTAVFAPARGGVWIGYLFGGFNFVKNGTVSHFPLVTGTVSAFTEDRAGIVWAATNSRPSGLWRFDGSTWQNIGSEWNVPVARLSQVGFDRDGILWALTEARGPEARHQLFFLEPGRRTFRTAGSFSVQGFTWDADRFVVTTHENGVRAADPAGVFAGALPAYPVLRRNAEQFLDRGNSVWSVPLEGQVLRCAIAGSVREAVGAMSPTNCESVAIDANRFANLVDREGSTWIGDQSGVHRLLYSPIAQLELPHAPGPLNTVVADRDGAVWVSAGNGDGLSTLYRVRDGRAEAYQQQGGVTSFAYRAPDDILWFGGEGGLWQMVNGRLTKIALPREMADDAQFLRSMTHDGDGGFWVSFGATGLYRLKDGAWTKFGGRRDLPTSGVVMAFTDTLNRVWFGSTQNRLAMLDGDHVQTFGPAEGLQVGTIGAIAGRGADVWVGGDFGVQQFGRGRFHTIHAVDHESLRGIVGIVETANGDLWLSGLGGIVHLRRADVLAAVHDPAHAVTVERFSRREGLPGLARQLGPIAVVEAADGRLWFAVRNGVVSLDPVRSKNASIAPRVMIQSISADEHDYGIDQPLRFPAGTSNVQIGFSAVSLSNPEAIRFRYRLPEVDNGWHEARTTSVSYRNLAPGSYRFTVSATDTNGTWSDNVAVAPFIVLPAFYQTAWFRAVAVALFLASLWTAYQLRMRGLAHQFNRTLEARVSERTRIARELHDTILQSFQGALLRFQSAANVVATRPDEARQRLDQALDQAEAAITEGRNAVHGLRASATTMNDLANGIAAIGLKLTREGSPGPMPLIDVAVDGKSQDLSPVVRDEAYQIAGEALRNAVKHAAAGRVTVTIHYESLQLRLTVRDDGKGIDAETLARQHVEGHFGLPGMRERAAIVKGRLDVRSESGAGTEIELRIPAAIAYRASDRRPWWFRLWRGQDEPSAIVPRP